MTKNKNSIKRVDLSQEIVNSNFTHFEANVIGGNIFIMPGFQGKAAIRVQWKENASNLLPKFFIEDNILKSESKSWKVFWGQKDAYIIEITLPENINIKVKMFAGVIDLENLSGDIDVSVRAGEISGNVSSKKFNARIWAGDINLTFDSVTKDSKIDLKCSLGDIKLKFPKNLIPDLKSKKMKTKKIFNTLNADITVKVTLGDVSIDS